ncbi:MAG: transaldolase, partial [Deltaproteobacteria bacterium]|nr:transaldolase [Deltaproteobacteria bacterium]
METKLPNAEAAAVEAALEAWTKADGTRRLLSGDAALWTGADEARWLGWLHAPETWTRELAHYRTLADGIREDGMRHALLLGMGGSSLCCEVLARTFGSGPGCPILEVVDSTVPSQIRAVDARIDPRRTICFVSSKSGSTIETDVARRHFFERIGDPQRFIAITDPGSGLEKRATEEGWRAVAHGEPEIGGRFSALSPFGLLPAAVLGIDVEDLLGRARRLAG